ncbi:Fms-interacting protein-domain-containing protein [Dichotomocladium elegans]|nr:Fms-interacting protein-domain-containing protein [Dichotomocladium elegans]
MPVPTNISTDKGALQAIVRAAEESHNLLVKYMKLKAAGDPIPNDGEDLSTLLDFLYDLHMTTFNDVRDSKQATTDARTNMDERLVGLQNVMYEKRHLLEEIVKCRAFRSVYQDVDLIDLEEFKARAPEAYSHAQDNPHQLMINRLKFEQEQRLLLKEEQEKLQAERALLIRENRKAQEKLDRFDKCLDDFVQAASPLEEALKDEREKKATSMELD